MLYGACGTAAYHDVTKGSNGDFTAGPGYDTVTGVGTVDVNAFIEVVAPPTSTSTTLPTGCG
jgi:kumamolisin